MGIHRSQRGFLGKHREMSVFHGFFHGFSMDIEAEEDDGSTWKHRDVQRNFLGSALPHPMLPHPPRIPWKAPGNSHMESSKGKAAQIRDQISRDQISRDHRERMDFPGTGKSKAAPGAPGIVSMNNKGLEAPLPKIPNPGAAGKERSSHGIPHPEFPWNSSPTIPPKFLTHSSHQTPFQDFPSRRLLVWVFWEFHDRQGEGNFGNCRKTRMGEEGPSLCSAPRSQPEKTAGMKGKPGKAEL